MIITGRAHCFITLLFIHLASERFDHCVLWIACEIYLHQGINNCYRLQCCGNNGNQFLFLLMFLFGNNTVMTITMTETPLCLLSLLMNFLLHFMSKYFCQYKTLFRHPVLFTYFLFINSRIL